MAWSSGSVWLIYIFDGHWTFRSRRVLSVHSRLMTGYPSLHALFHLSTHPWKRRFVRGLPLLSVYVSGSKSTVATPSTCAPATAAVTVPRKNSTATLRTVRGSTGQSARLIVMLRVSPVRGPFCDHVNSVGTMPVTFCVRASLLAVCAWGPPGGASPTPWGRRSY